MPNIPFIAVKIYCVPPDIEEDNPEALAAYLTRVEADLQKHRPTALKEYDEIIVGISLVNDVSKYRIGDVIWIEAEYRGVSEVRAITFEDLRNTGEKLGIGLQEFVFNHVNASRVNEDKGRVSCSFISVTVGAENAPVTASSSSKM